MVDSRRTSHPLTDLELLELAAENSMDGRRRLAGIRGVTVAATAGGYLLLVGSEVPDTLVPTLSDQIYTSHPTSAPDSEPAALAACRAILESACAPLSLDASQYYLIEPNVRIETQTDIARSDTPSSEQLWRLNPGNWDHDEWDELLDGALGPWAMAVVDGRVVSLCHTPGPMTERAAECGVWTHPDYRGQGYAAAVTATWAAILRPSGRHLFYSTNARNLSSQRVAARLRLRPIGWTWSLTRANLEQHDRRHPLSRPSS